MTKNINTWWRERRRIFFMIFVVFLLGYLEIRLIDMQLLNRPEFLKQANANRIRAEVIEPTRGGIYDRYGQLLIENRPSYTLYAHPWTMKRNQQTLPRLSAMLDMDQALLSERIGRNGWYTFQPTPILRDVSFTQLAHLETQKIDLPGIQFGFVAKRSYPLPEAVHLLGYVGENSGSNTRNQKGRLSLVGKHGLELVYEKWLGGKPGTKYVQVNVSGKNIGPEADNPLIPPENGWDLILNIDGRLQRYAYDLMEGRVGAVVAIDPRDGGVLTMLSLPDYDPSLFAGVMPEEIWEDLISDPGHPLLNRALQGLYPPGSTFKMAILAAGLEEKVVNTSTEEVCIGGLQLGRRFFLCWNKGGHGKVDCIKAIQQSCDVYFYHLGLKLEVDRMSEYARRFGFGQITNTDFDVDFKGIIPNTEYMDRKYGKGQWTAGHSANISIGQGDVLVTPMQLAVYTAALATGKMVKPRIANMLVNPVTHDTVFVEPEISDLQISSKTLNILREGMRQVVNVERGTAYWLRRKDVVIAGKTGTSQNPHGEDHALFVAFAPFENPVIAVAVVIEHGEHGSTAAAPVAVKLIDQYLSDFKSTSEMSSTNTGPIEDEVVE